MTPREIVLELDKYVVGQQAAKRAVAIALRNRMRRQKLAPDLADEIMPKNIIMIGPTGVGKTEIARRLAKLTNSPFLKVEGSKSTEGGHVGRDGESMGRGLVEASKFREVGYVRRDVEPMVRDLVEISIDIVREEKLDEIEDRAELGAEDRLVDLLAAQGAAAGAPAADGGVVEEPKPAAPGPVAVPAPTEAVSAAAAAVDEKSVAVPSLALVSKSEAERTREKERLRHQFREGKLDDRMVEI